MKKIGKREIVMSLLDALKEEELKPDEFTLAEYIQITKDSGVVVTQDSAEKKLRRMEDAGILTKRKVLHNSHWTNAYRRKE